MTANPELPMTEVPVTGQPVLRDPGIARLQDQIASLRRVDFRQVRSGPMPELDALSAAIAATLGDCFVADSASGRRFLAAAALAPAQSAQSGPHDGGLRLRQAVRGNVQRAIALLEDAQRVLYAHAADVTPAPPASLPDTPAGWSRHVLVVHDRDDRDGGAHRRVVRFLAGAGLEPVSLARPAWGGTVIGRLEACHEAGFAVMLLTPDDAGRARGGPGVPPARPYALLELGYLMGRLGRSRVCVFTPGTPDLPGELAGVAWHSLGRTPGWQPVLGRALRAAGYAVDDAAGQDAGRRP